MSNITAEGDLDRDQKGCRVTAMINYSIQNMMLTA
jgi:hypothetical protein